ncbi:unnamed protein product [Trichobilharzia szidati]|nr:unnamed protein product [Trichobilharzia szidati]
MKQWIRNSSSSSSEDCDEPQQNWLAPMPQSMKCDNDDDDDNMQTDTDEIDDKLDNAASNHHHYGPLPLTTTTESNKESFSPLKKSSMPSTVSTTGAYYEKWLIPGL